MVSILTSILIIRQMVTCSYDNTMPPFLYSKRVTFNGHVSVWSNIHLLVSKQASHTDLTSKLLCLPIPNLKQKLLKSPNPLSLHMEVLVYPIRHARATPGSETLNTYLSKRLLCLVTSWAVQSHYRTLLKTYSSITTNLPKIKCFWIK